MGRGEAWGKGPEHLSSRVQAWAWAWKAEKATLSTADWLGGWCMPGSTSHAHRGRMLTGVSRLGRSGSWLFRATVGVACGHSQLLQYLKWFNNTQGENAEFKIKGKPRRGEAAYTKMGEALLVTGA